MHEKFAKAEAKMDEVKSVKETLLSWVKEEVNAGKECFQVDTVGDVVDMIKDLSKTEKDCAEALYYMAVVKAMLEAEESPYGNMGYNHRHMANGRFAPSGEGHVVYGYHPYIGQQSYIDGYLNDPDFKSNMSRMGYPDGMPGRMNHNDYNSDRGTGSKYGRSYDNYQTARRHYTMSKDPAMKEEMNHHAMEHVDNTLESLQEMWESSDDTMLKKRIVDEMSKVLSEMKSNIK